MKKSVKYSGWSWTWTAIITLFCVIFGITWYINGKYEKAIVLTVAFALLVITALIYAPLYVKVTDKHLAVRRPLKSRVIDMADIASVELFPPTMGEIRICGSGGWFGYWGWFKERDLGKYFAYYGRSSDCYLVKLKNGRQYIIGSEDAADVVEAILRHIS